MPWPGGGTETVAHPSGAASLDDADVRTLARLGRRVEALFGAPQDIEWALDGDGRAVADPVAADHDAVPARARAPGPAPVPLGERRAGRVPAVHPRRALRGPAPRLRRRRPARCAGRRPRAGPADARPRPASALFVDLTDVLRSRVGRAGAAGRARGHGDPLGRGHRDPARPAASSPSPGARPCRPSGGSAGSPSATASRRAVVGAWVRPARARERAFALVRDGRRRPCPRRPEPGRVERVDRVRWMLTDALRAVAPAYRAGAGGRFPRPRPRRPPAPRPRPSRRARHRAARAAAQRHHRDGPRAVARWPAGSATTLPPCAALTGPRPSSSPGSVRAWPPALQDGLTDFLAAYGHRAVAEIDLGMPRWRDDPTHLLGVLANYLQLDDPDLRTGAPVRRRCADREARSTDRRRHPRSGPAGRCGRVVVRLALHRARDLIGLRERPKSLWVYALAAARAELQAVGDAAVAAGADRGRATTSSSWTCRRPGSARRRRPPGEVRGTASRTRSSCGAATSRGCCCPTAPSRRR